MKKVYTPPQIDVEIFEAEDIITTSVNLGDGDSDIRDPIELPDI